MALQLSLECWMQTFHYLNTKADLHSCLLVNRNWCRMIVSILWENPFSHALSNEKLKSILKTYLKCSSKKSIERMEGARMSDEIFNEKPMFYYPGFLRELVVDPTRFDLCIYHLFCDLKIKKKGKQKDAQQEDKDSQEERSEEDLKKKYEDIQQKYSEELDIIFEVLIDLICGNSNRIRSLSITPCKMLDYIIPLLKDGDNNFHRIKTFTLSSIPTTSKVHELIIALSRASRDITHIRIINGYQLGESLETLLNSQNNLYSLDLEYRDEQKISYYEPVLSTLKSPQIISSLSSLSFKNIDFSSITQQSINSLAELSRNLKIFKVAQCVNCLLLCDIMRSCENLVEFTYETYKFGKDSEFLFTILKSSSNSLKHLDVFWIRVDSNLLLEKSKLIKCITEHCTQLTSLKLRGLHSEDLFSIWYSCKRLEVISFLCCEQSDWNDCLEDLGRILPCTLKVLKIGNWIEIPFSAVALEGFLKGCRESLKKLEIYSLKKLSEHSEYMNVLNNSGIYYELF